MIENWKDVVGYEGLYQVSSLGTVKSLDRVVSNHQGSGVRRGKIMSFTECKGYHRVILTKNAKHKSPFVQRLVAEAFIPNPENKKEVNHLNGVKTDNRACNLEWVTPSENMKHAYDKGLKKGLTGASNPKSKKVIDTLSGTVYESETDAAKAFNLKRRNLARQLSGERKNKTTLKLLSECA